MKKGEMSKGEERKEVKMERKGEKGKEEGRREEKGKK